VVKFKNIKTPEASYLPVYSKNKKDGKKIYLNI
jgi:hypothetical protein